MNLQTSTPFWRHAQGNWTDGSCSTRIDMKTNEELQGMTHDELVAYTQNLQRESEEYKKSMLYYSEEKKKIESKFDNFKNLVKSLVVLVD